MPEFPFYARAVTFPQGFRAAGARGRLKSQGPDVALIAGDAPCAAAAVFTTNRFVAAPVIVSRECSSTVRGIVVNSGCANAATGNAGIADARRMAALAATEIGCNEREVIVASTGVIGHALPMDKIQWGIRDAAAALSSEDDHDAALAIMTTDTRPKTAIATVALCSGEVRIGGICKGSGMIAPNMATMLGFLTTDAAIEPPLLQTALAAAVKTTFNAVTVDGDMSTNDMVALLASGTAGNSLLQLGTPDFEAFQTALTGVCDSLARQIAWDGEGATKLVVVDVSGADSEDDARKIARTIAESPLTKTALFGNDPNWGRILAAAGRAGVAFDPSSVELHIGDVALVRNGAPLPFNHDNARAAIVQEDVSIRLHLHKGPAAARMYTCDFSYDYVRINAEYHT